MMIMRKILFSVSMALFLNLGLTACGKDNGGEGGSGGNGSSTVDPYEGQGGYLFAHTGTGSNYYKLFYAYSRDGIKWTALKRGASPMTTYRGFPYITRDAKGTFWLIGTSSGSLPHFPIIWWSDDMITWKHKDLPRAIMDLPEGYENDTNSFGAMKIFFDAPSEQFMITWHAEKSGLSGDARWESMRTFYILTKDFVTFTPAARLFEFSGADENMAQIDASIHFHDGKYYAVIKDERWPSTASTGKTVRIAQSASLTGPWTNPGGSVTPAWREAPTMVQSPDGAWWYMYVEDYTVHQYELYRSSSLTNGLRWEKVDAMAPPAGDNCRHGCVIRIEDSVYKKLRDTYDK